MVAALKSGLLLVDLKFRMLSIQPTNNVVGLHKPILESPTLWAKHICQLSVVSNNKSFTSNFDDRSAVHSDG